MVNQREIKAKNAVNWLARCGCLDSLLSGELVEVNTQARIGKSGSTDVVKRVRENVDEILTQHYGGIKRIRATEINPSRRQIVIKPEYREQFSQAVEAYRGQL